MSKLHQFRCPKCLRLLFKTYEGATNCEYMAAELKHKQAKDKMIVECTKCFTVLEVVPNGLIEFKAATQDARV